jgi:hypothetical protein
MVLISVINLELKMPSITYAAKIEIVSRTLIYDFYLLFAMICLNPRIRL